jgi:hypothetical protein
MPLVLAAAATPIAATDSTITIQISGTVMRGQRAQRNIRELGARFVLEPTDEGWDIRIVGTDTTASFADVVTPPFHGPNPLNVMGWHFRDTTGTAPGRQRDFEFVLNDADQRAAASALDVISWPGDRGLAGQDSAQAVWDNLPRGHGRFNIRSVELVRTPDGSTDPPRIARMTFSAWLTWPVSSAAQKQKR